MVEVRVTGKGVARDDEATQDASVVAHCSVCDTDAELVVSIVDEIYACKDCLRVRLDATSVAAWRLREPSPGGLPWGKISG